MAVSFAFPSSSPITVKTLVLVVVFGATSKEASPNFAPLLLFEIPVGVSSVAFGEAEIFNLKKL
jgi:hypothetical protein